MNQDEHVPFPERASSRCHALRTTNHQNGQGSLCVSSVEWPSLYVVAINKPIIDIVTGITYMTRRSLFDRMNENVPILPASHLTLSIWMDRGLEVGYQ